MRHLPLALVCIDAVLTMTAVPVWRSDVNLWAQAAAVAPGKPRPALNLGRALLLQGQTDQADRWFTTALALAQQPHLPDYDRNDAVMAATSNLQTTAILRVVFVAP